MTTRFVYSVWFQKNFLSPMFRVLFSVPLSSRSSSSHHSPVPSFPRAALRRTTTGRPPRARARGTESPAWSPAGGKERNALHCLDVSFCFSLSCLFLSGLAVRLGLWLVNSAAGHRDPDCVAPEETARLEATPCEALCAGQCEAGRGARTFGT